MNGRFFSKALLILLAFLGVMFLYVLEFRYLGSTLGADKLVVGSMLAGAVLGAAAAFFFRSRVWSPLERFQLFTGLIILSAVIAPLPGSLTNRLLSWHAPRHETVEFIELSARYVSRFGLEEGDRPEPNQYFLFFNLDGDQYRVPVEESQYSGYSRGDSLQLLLKKGLWGFDIVLE
jgi:hypothetical protein